MLKVTIINGPNLNLLGKRQPDIYGKETLDSLNARLKEFAREKNISLTFFQTAYEGKIIELLHLNKDDCIILNAGALSHYSYSIRDAIASINIPVVEVHISDITSREEFRKISVLTPVCKDNIIGKGVNGYFIALERLLKEKNESDI